jgi:hypothetical protein
MNAGAMALLYDAASGAERSLPAMEPSCTPHHRAPARAASMDTVVVHPAGAVLDGWDRTGPHSRGAKPLRPGGTRAVPVQRVTG